MTNNLYCVHSALQDNKDNKTTNRKYSTGTVGTVYHKAKRGGYWYPEEKDWTDWIALTVTIALS